MERGLRRNAKPVNYNVKTYFADKAMGEGETAAKEIDDSTGDFDPTSQDITSRSTTSLVRSKRRHLYVARSPSRT